MWRVTRANGSRRFDWRVPDWTTSAFFGGGIPAVSPASRHKSIAVIPLGEPVMKRSRTALQHRNAHWAPNTTGSLPLWEIVHTDPARDTCSALECSRKERGSNASAVAPIRRTRQLSRFSFLRAYQPGFEWLTAIFREEFSIAQPVAHQKVPIVCRGSSTCISTKGTVCKRKKHCTIRPIS
jgi:hypothetical protein